MMQAFGDGFDLYAAITDPLATYWDGSTNTSGMTLAAGRFTGSQALQLTAATSGAWYKNSGSNDAVHHLVCAVMYTTTPTGTNMATYLTLGDGATAQCSVVFRGDGAIVLTSGASTGTALATYTGAVTAANTWTAFEVEVVINNTTGSITVRKNGNTGTPDFTLGSLNTRTTTNNYASRLTLGMNAPFSAQRIDDLLWRSDPSAVPWVGDIRCYTRMPASDVQAQFSKSPATTTVTPQPINSSTAITAGNARYVAFTAPYDGTIGTATVSLSVGYTGNMKCSLFLSVGGVPTTVLGSATPLSNPATGVNTLTFPTPVSVTKGGSYFIGVDSDTTSGTWNSNNNAALGLQSTTPYASFPAASPTTSTNGPPGFTVTLTVGDNCSLVNETLEDGATSYVFDSNVGDADFYAIAALAGTPASTVCVTTRGFFEKSDSGTRSAAVQLKSGATTVASASTALGTSFGWLWRTDLNDPNTGSAWSATGVNNVQIGPTTTA